MARQVTPLSDTQVRQAKASEKPTKLFDGGGLFLLITPPAKNTKAKPSKIWRFKYRFNGKEKQISFGAYPDLSLAEAREKRAWARGLVASGIDPSLAKKNEREEAAARQANTFRRLADEWYGQQGTLAEKTKLMLWRRLEVDVFPVIGNTPNSELTPKMVLDGVLRPIEKREAVELAHRTKSLVSRILRYGVACGYVERDVTADLRGALQPFKRKHLPAITDPKKVGGLLRALEGFDGSAIVKTALLLHPLVATRPGELRHMEWSEIDFEEGTWNIPAGKMKMKTPHLVPLSRQAIEILRAIQPLTGSGRYVFHSVRSVARPISDNTLNAAMRRLGFEKDEMTSHGWRAVFRTLAAECLHERIDLIEMQLAHRVADALGRAYNRTTFLPERRTLMQRWADYLDSLKQSTENVIPFARRG